MLKKTKHDLEAIPNPSSLSLFFIMFEFHYYDLNLVDL